MLLKFNLDRGLNLCFQESYSLSCFYKQRLAKLSKIDNEPHLVFLGTDAYNIEKQIQALTKRKIHIHLCTKDALSIYDQKYVHKFDKFTYEKLFNGEFATFLTQFDACLVTYNFEGASALARYQNGLPNRFSFALSAGIPLVLPNGYLNACQQVVEEHKIGFAYETFDDLASALLEKDTMDKCALNALSNRESFALEKNFDKINTFIKAVIG